MCTTCLYGIYCFDFFYKLSSYQNGERQDNFLTRKKGNMANRLGNKIWKEKSRIGMSRKKTKSKNYFTKQEKGTVVE